MATVKRFEDLEAWKKARLLCNAVYSCTRRREFYRDLALRDQIRNAAISVPSNVAEGFDRGGRKEFIQFLSIAKGSAGEIQAQLYVALDERYLTSTEFKEAYALADETKRIIGGLMRYLQRSPIGGSKYKKEN